MVLAQSQPAGTLFLNLKNFLFQQQRPGGIQLPSMHRPKTGAAVNREFAHNHWGGRLNGSEIHPRATAQ
jgi:hypothetical protein